MIKTKIFLIFLSIIFAVFLITACNAPTGEVVKEEDRVVKFGVIASLTGEAAQWGEALKNGMIIAQKELAIKDTHFKYEFVIEDDQLQNAKTVSAFHKLNGVDKINALVSFSSGSGNAIAPLAEQNQVITCSVASDPAIVKDRKYVFKHWVTPEAEAEKYVEELDRRELKTVGMISTNQQGVLAVFLELEKRLGNRIVFNEVIDPDIKDFRTEITKLKQINPDTLYTAMLPGQVTPLMRQLEEMNYQGDVSNIETFEYEEAAIPYLEGRWYINTAEEKGHFKEIYEAEYGEKPLVASGNAYDCIMLIVEAYEKAKTKNPDLVVRELHKIKDYEGALGTLYIDDENSVQSPAVVKEVRNGEFVVVRE
ncbi:ABC transporter substrate-binding protein [Candidatus Woesearchaeota archaeon]|nr:ABC transporter substrate-binding protein [Candidatus Woesearchaeota archaeon]